MRKESNWSLDVASLGKFLRECREISELTPGQVSVYLGVKTSAIYHYETGINAPSAKILIALCDLYEIDLNALTKFVYRSRKKRTPK